MSTQQRQVNHRISESDMCIPKPTIRVPLGLGQKLWGKYEVISFDSEKCEAAWAEEVRVFHRSERPNGLFLVEGVNGNQAVIATWP